MTNPKIKNFDLVETILWENGEFFLLNLHLERLKKSAEVFGFPYNEGDVNKFLEDASNSFDPSGKYRMRLLLKRSGKIQLSSSPLDPPENLPVKITISDKRTDRNDIFLRHKTTNRELYDREFTKCRTNGFYDCVFLNEDSEVTEGAISNIIVKHEQEHWTPPLASGVLPGVYRQHFIETGELGLKEKVLYAEDLLNAEKIYMINSVRGILPAVLA
ncbi:MAG: aminotransferase class IV [Candidatus Omnitrophica bacterium]|nr:aminotransferase class IV [Candidatus Omnitrophota bacterium]